MIVGGATYQDKIRDWVSRELGFEKIGGDNFAAAGILVNNELVGGAVFHDLTGHMMEISLATTSPKWCTRKHIKELLSYPFVQCGYQRLNARCAKKNKKMRRLMERFGFKEEGCARKAYVMPDGQIDDCVIYGMLKEECKWI